MEENEVVKPVELDPNISDEEALAKLAEVTGEENEGHENTDGNNENNIPFDSEELEVFKSVYGEEFGEDFFKDNGEVIKDKKEALKKVVSAIAEKSKAPVEYEDEFVKSYVEAKKQNGFDKTKFIENLAEGVSIDKADNEEFLRKRLKNTGNYTDEDVNEFLQKKTKIEIDEMAKAEKVKYNKELTDKNALEYQKNINTLKANIETQNSEIKNAVTKYTNEKLKAGKFPIKFKEEELSEIEDTIKDSLRYELVKLEDGTVIATQKIFNEMRDNEILEQIIPFVALAKKGKLTSFLKEYSEGIKDKEFNKIKDQPGIGAGASEGSFNADSFFNQ